MISNLFTSIQNIIFSYSNLNGLIEKNIFTNNYNTTTTTTNTGLKMQIYLTNYTNLLI